MKITTKNGSDLRPITGDYSTTTLIELSPESKMARIPTNVVFLIDASSSMGGDKWSTVKSAVSEILSSLQDDDRVGVVLFHTSSKEIFPLASLAENRTTMQEKIKELASPSGVTNLEAGLKTAYQVFEKRSDQDRVKRVNHVILLTDGFPTDDQGYRIEETKKYEDIVRRQEHITLTGVGIGSADDYDSNFISKISDLGRGSFYHANNLEKFKEGLQAEIAKLQSSVVGNLVLKFSDLSSRVMRIAKIAPEIVIYDIPGNAKGFELPTGSMTKDMTSFIVQTNSQGSGIAGAEIPLFSLTAIYDQKSSETVIVKIKTTEREADLSQVDPDVFKGIQVLQVHLNGEQIQASLESGDKDKATRLIANTTKIATNLGQTNVTRALTRLATDLSQGKSVADDLATIKDESKKTRLLMK